MPAFHYDDYRNPYVGSISDLLLRPGEIEAARSARVAEAQARASEISGQAWGNAVQTAGNAVAGAVTAQADPQRKLNELQLKEAQSQAKSKLILEAELRNPANYPGGKLDEDLVATKLQKQDVGAASQFRAISQAQRTAALEFQTKTTALATAQLTNDEKKRQVQALQADYLGKLAYNALDVIKQKPADADHTRQTLLAGISLAAGHGAITAEEARDFEAKMRAVPADRISEVLEAFVTPDLKASLDAAKGTQAKTAAETAKAQAEADNLKKYGRATAPESQQATFVLDGKGDPVQGSYVPDAQGGRYYYKGEDVSGRITKPSAAVQSANNPEALATQHDNAMQVFKGNLLPEDLSKRGASYNATLADANKISIEQTGKPINITQRKLDYQSAKKWVATMNAPQMVRYRGLAESVVNTIDEVQRLAEELQQGGVQLWNKVTRKTVQQVYGNTPQSELANQYVGAVNTLKEEFANLANGGFAPTESAWKLANEQINGDFGFRDMNASLTEVQRLINFRSRAIADQQPVKAGDQPPPPAPAPAPKPAALTPGLAARASTVVALPTAADFAGKDPGDYPATSPDGKTTVTVHWDGKTVTVK